MKVLLCMDDGGGLLFNHRRVSSDRVVTERVNEIAGSALSITEFSYKLFPEASVISADHVLELGYNDFFFLENVRLAPIIDMVSELFVFRWNRRYPSDFSLDIVPEEVFTLISMEEFAGNSHEKITLEVWKNEKQA